MAITPAYTGSPSLTDATLSGTPNTLLQVNLPSPSYQYIVSLQARTTEAYFTVSGTDGAAVGAAARVVLPIGVIVRLEKQDRAILFLGSATGSQVVSVILERAF